MSNVNSTEATTTETIIVADRDENGNRYYGVQGPRGYLRVSAYRPGQWRVTDPENPGIVKNGGSLDRALDRALFLVSE